MHNILRTRGDQMLRGGASAFVVIGADIRVKAAFEAVHGHQGSLGVRNIHQCVGVSAADNAVHLIGEKHLEVALFLLGVVVAIAENDAVACLGKVTFEAVHHLPVEGVSDRGEDEAHHLRALTLQATGDGVGPVAEFPHCLVDLGAGAFAQVAAVVEHAGDRGGGDSRQGRNVAEFGLSHGGSLRYAKRLTYLSTIPRPHTA